MFFVDATQLRWLDDSAEDLCVHGNAVAIIGNERFEYECNVSATAFYLLKTLTQNHIMGEDNQLLPCCGHAIFPRGEANDCSDLMIIGCPDGIDWTVVHCANGVKIITEQRNETFVEMGEYRKVVHGFVDKIKRFYEQSPQRKLTGDAFDRRMYDAFWEEWERRRKQTRGDMCNEG